MRITRRTAVIIAVVCAAGAALLSVVYLRSLTPKAPSEPQVVTVPVPVPVATLPAGTRITAEKLTSANLPRETLPADVITDPKQLEGQVLVAEARAGEPIPRTRLAAFSPQAGLAFVVPPGMRAVTVAVDNISGVSGFLKLGDHVDVLATFEVPQKVVTRTILQDVEVLGLGTESVTPQAGEARAAEGAKPAGGEQAPPPGSRPSATLAVTPQQAQILVLAANKGRLHLALRPKSDTRMVALAPASNEQVIGVSLTPPPAPATGAAAPAGQAVGTMGAAGERTAAGLTPGTPGAAPAPGPAAAPTGPPKPSVEVFKGTQREIVTP